MQPIMHLIIMNCHARGVTHAMIVDLKQSQLVG